MVNMVRDIASLFCMSHTYYFHRFGKFHKSHEFSFLGELALQAHRDSNSRALLLGG